MFSSFKSYYRSLFFSLFVLSFISPIMGSNVQNTVYCPLSTHKTIHLSTTPNRTTAQLIERFDDDTQYQEPLTVLFARDWDLGRVCEMDEHNRKNYLIIQADRTGKKLIVGSEQGLLGGGNGSSSSSGGSSRDSFSSYRSSRNSRRTSSTRSTTSYNEDNNDDSTSNDGSYNNESNGYDSHDNNDRQDNGNNTSDNDNYDSSPQQNKNSSSYTSSSVDKKSSTPKKSSSSSWYSYFTSTNNNSSYKNTSTDNNNLANKSYKKTSTTKDNTSCDEEDNEDNTSDEEESYDNKKGDYDGDDDNRSSSPEQDKKSPSCPSHNNKSPQKSSDSCDNKSNAPKTSNNNSWYSYLFVTTNSSSSDKKTLPTRKPTYYRYDKLHKWKFDTSSKNQNSQKNLKPIEDDYDCDDEESYDEYDNDNNTNESYDEESYDEEDNCGNNDSKTNLTPSSVKIDFSKVIRDFIFEKARKAMKSQSIKDEQKTKNNTFYDELDNEDNTNENYDEEDYDESEESYNEYDNIKNDHNRFRYTSQIKEYDAKKVEKYIERVKQDKEFQRLKEQAKNPEDKETQKELKAHPLYEEGMELMESIQKVRNRRRMVNSIVAFPLGDLFKVIDHNFFLGKKINTIRENLGRETSPGPVSDSIEQGKYFLHGLVDNTKDLVVLPFKGVKAVYKEGEKVKKEFEKVYLQVQLDPIGSAEKVLEVSDNLCKEGKKVIKGAYKEGAKVIKKVYKEGEKLVENPKEFVIEYSKKTLEKTEYVVNKVEENLLMLGDNLLALEDKIAKKQVGDPREAHRIENKIRGQVGAEVVFFYAAPIVVEKIAVTTGKVVGKIPQVRKLTNWFKVFARSNKVPKHAIVELEQLLAKGLQSEVEAERVALLIREYPELQTALKEAGALTTCEELLNCSKGGNVSKTILNRKDILKNIPKNIKSGMQGKHIPNHNSFMKGRSILRKDAQKLLNGVHNGQYEIVRVINKNKVLVNFNKNIGDFYKNKKFVDSTKYGIVHIAKDGVHIVPASPLQKFI